MLSHVETHISLALSTSLNDLEIAALHIDGQSIDVDAPPDIIDVVDEDDDIIDEEDPIPHDLADSDDEDLVNLDIDDGHQKAQFGWQGVAGRQLYPPGDPENSGLKAITDKSGPVPIRFEVNDRETLMPLGDHAAHWANYLGELVRELPLQFPFLAAKCRRCEKAGVVAKIGDGDLSYREYPSLIHTFFLTQTVGGVFLNPEDKALYDEMLRLQGLGSITPTGGRVQARSILSHLKARNHLRSLGQKEGEAAHETSDMFIEGSGVFMAGDGDDEARMVRTASEE
ncbi:hypothetical protein Tco_0128592 [Tanacetum coccineum]